MQKKNLIWFSIIIVIVLALFVINQFNNRFFKTKEEKVDEVITEEEYIYVYIHGQTKVSGVFYVPSNWIIANLIEMVGLKDEADLSNINLSKRLESGESYYIPSKGEELNNYNNGLLNINTATKSELESLPGIGSVLAERIIAYRKITPFKDIAEIKNVTGIGEAVFEKVKSFITV